MTEPNDLQIRNILTGVKTVALVGWSPDPTRPSHGVAEVLRRRGIRVLPVNPGQAGHDWQGERVRASLADCAGDGVEMVDVFRRSDAVAGIVTEMLANLPEARVLWLQLGVGDPAAEARAEAAGVTVVANRCPAIEIRRLGL